MKQSRYLAFLAMPFLIHATSYAAEPAQSWTKPKPFERGSAKNYWLGIDKKPQPHSAALMWQGLDPGAVGNANILIYIAENCPEALPEDQIKKAKIILKATASHPMAKTAHDVAVNWWLEKYKDKACDHIYQNQLLQQPL
ncbi:hypothetical protein KCX83_15615 [Brucella oryzae]|uniref:hypothetical protein n=1 Tax=Brucella oryzae TaxID=335286 RepID=UPI001B844EAA|nr:hypothetical protein [Brucella oryzae]MBR7653748.1 hypothetical protein [Brucella oryzae]